MARFLDLTLVAVVRPGDMAARGGNFGGRTFDVAVAAVLFRGMKF